MWDFLDCITVDFKGSGETGFVRKYITIANADPIFQTLLELRERTKVHIEITDLIVPEVGDDLGAAKKLSSWVYDNLGPDTPIHFLRFHSDYKMMNLQPTPIKTLKASRSRQRRRIELRVLGQRAGAPARTHLLPRMRQGCCRTPRLRHHGLAP